MFQITYPTKKHLQVYTTATTFREWRTPEKQVQEEKAKQKAKSKQAESKETKLKERNYQNLTRNKQDYVQKLQTTSIYSPP